MMQSHDPLKVKIADRYAGKTTVAMYWVQEGTRCPGYPGWTRVLVLPTLQMYNNARSEWWRHTEEFDHRIFTWRSWKDARGVSPDTQVVIDNIEWVLPPVPGHLVGFTTTGQAWL